VPKDWRTLSAHAANGLSPIDHYVTAIGNPQPEWQARCWQDVQKNVELLPDDESSGHFDRLAACQSDSPRITDDG